MQKNRVLSLDLLRVLAIVSVIFYHAKLNIPYLGFKNGYLGVDIFFFLSGYLLTHIYRKNIYEFSMSNFLRKRIYRILPAYLVVCFFVLIFCFFYYLPYPFINIAKETINSLFFISNYYYSVISFNYAADPSLLKPLLHTWTLSVEAQVYIILAFVYKIKNQKIFILCILILSIVSFVICLLNEYSINNKTYYLTEYRIWQFLFGSLLALMKYNFSNNKYNLIFIIIAILTLIIFLNNSLSQSLFLNSFIVLTICGIIVKTPIKNINSNQLINIIKKNIIFFSKLSYSIYLWHYPIFAFARYHFERSSEQIILVKLLILSSIIIIPVLSYNIIEKPFLKNDQK